MTLSHEEFARLANEGGASRSFETGEPAVGPGVMVSVPGAEKITKAPTSAKEVAEYRESFPGATSKYYQGAWRSGDKIFHDVSKKEPSLDAARKSGVLGKQIAGYDLGGTDVNRPEGGNVYFGRTLPGIQASEEWKEKPEATSVAERLEPKPSRQDKVDLANVNRGAVRAQKRGKKVTGRQVPVTINEVLATIAKNRRNRGV